MSPFPYRILRNGSIFVAILVVYLWSQGYLLAPAKEPFVISPVEIDLGDCDSGSQHIASIKFSNLSDRPIRIVGSEVDCKCLALDELPVTVDPGHTQNISVRAYVSGSENYSQMIILYVDDDGLRTSTVRIRARVRQSPQAEKGASVSVPSLGSLV